ncbi:MAG: cytochrome-c peroxidase, partial [Bacteroidota bacterium]
MQKLPIPFFLLLGAIMLSAGTIDLNNLLNYANQAVPTYITKDNTPIGNDISDAGATLGRVLFYDKNLSLNQSVSCSSCHQQAFAFSDPMVRSVGLSGGLTGRHSMRLVNSRFADEVRFFWDERATSLEDQVTQPIQDHVEMGFSGADGDPAFDSLINRLESIEYYDDLFTLAFGDDQISEARIQQALAQFVRSIQSFDSKFDVGRAQVPNNAMPFPNFSQEENTGKQLFIQPAGQGGAGCAGCHRPPEFDIDPNSLNNGVIGVVDDSLSTDLTNTRSPSLRDLVNPDGLLNGPLMHDGSFDSLIQVIEHYNLIVPGQNNNLDLRLRGGPGPNPPGQDLQLTDAQKNALVAFLGTLTG